MNSKILSQAADHIQVFGFIGTEYYQAVFEDLDGNAVRVRDLRLTGEHRRRDPRRCPVCPRGAIAVAAGAHPMFAVEDGADPAAAQVIASAERALVTYLLDETHWRPPAGASHYSAASARAPELIETWAGQDRAQDEVVAAMRAAGELERSKGR